VGGSTQAVAAVIPTLRSGPHADACLTALARAEPAVSIVLVDDDSDPQRLAPLAAAHPQATVVPLPGNHGFAGAANAGLRHAFGAGATAVLLLNDDVVLDQPVTGALLAAAGPRGVAAPRIEGDDEIAFAGGAVDPRRGHGRHAPGRIDFLTFACVLITRAAWEAVGELDEGLFLYYEDVDWCLRARRLGIPLEIGEVRVHHVVNATTGGSRSPLWGYYDTRNRLIVLARYQGGATALRELPRTLASIARQWPRRGPDATVARARLRGARDFVLRRRGARH
jgi:GT2 family glycosyltransferase